LCELCVSREQEYRADAVAIRLTRNPLGLAEALHLIETHWRGVGAQGESLSTIFIVEPGTEYLSEREGLFPDWFSTHPPTRSRIEALLGMAHMPLDDFQLVMARHRRKRPQQPAPDKPAQVTPPRWFTWLDGLWQGPWTLGELAGLESLQPDSWLRCEGESTAKPAFQDPQVLSVLQRRYGDEEAGVKGSTARCPNCHISLARVLYEGVPLDECPACRGCYVTPDKMSRIFAREEYAFSETIKRMAQAIPAIQGTERITKAYSAHPSNRLRDRQCPACGAAVIRKFYTSAFLVEVEQCWICGLTWLDKDELELLQHLYEQARAQGRSTRLESG